MENTVEMNNPGIVPDDAAQAQEEPQGEALSTLMEEAPEKPAEQENQVKEPGWIQKRISQAVARERRNWEAEQEEKLAPLYESMYDRQAQELVSAGEFKSIDTAKEYVRMKHGAVSIPKEEPAKEPAKNDPVIQARADLLSAQADKIKRNRGLDVMEAFNANPEIQQKILSGEWDFYDVADAMRVPPSPVRSPNSGGFNPVSIQNMSDEQFRRLQANLASGRKYDMRK